MLRCALPLNTAVNGSLINIPVLTTLSLSKITAETKASVPSHPLDERHPSWFIENRLEPLAKSFDAKYINRWDYLDGQRVCKSQVIPCIVQQIPERLFFFFSPSRLFCPRLPDGFTQLRALAHLALNDVSLQTLPSDIGKYVHVHSCLL